MDIWIAHRDGWKCDAKGFGKLSRVKILPYGEECLKPGVELIHRMEGVLSTRKRTDFLNGIAEAPSLTRHYCGPA